MEKIMEEWQTILLAFGGNAALLAVLGFIGKSLLEKLIARDTAVFENELNAKSEVAIEKLRHELATSSYEYQVKYAKLHEKRAEAIAEAYALLADLHTDLSEYVRIFEPVGIKSKEERRLAVSSSHEKFITYYRKHKIFLPKEAVLIIEKINSQTKSAFYQFFYGVEAAHASNQDTQKWLDIFNKVNEDIPQALEELDENFRKALGEK